MANITADRPRRDAAIDVYSTKYYDERVKAAFDAEWASIKGTVPDKERIARCKVYTRDCWKKESSEFRAKIEAEIEAKYKAKMEAYRDGQAVLPKSAKDYASALATADRDIVPFVNAIAQRLGAYVAVVIVCPIPNEGGEIGVRSVHSEPPPDASTSKIWPLCDPMGFKATDESLIKYGRHKLFSKDVCASRAYSGDDVLEPASASAPTESAETSESGPIHNPANPTPSQPNTVQHNNASDTAQADGVSAATQASVPEATTPPSSHTHEPSDTAPTPAAAPAPVAAPTSTLAQLPLDPSPSPDTVGSLPATITPATLTSSSASDGDQPENPTPGTAPLPAPAEGEVAHPVPCLRQRVPGAASLVSYDHIRLDQPFDTNVWPSELKRTYDYLMEHSDWGLRWEQCKAALVEFERSAMFPPTTKKRLSTYARPEEVATWQK
ncbi:hypothetical protein HGRIS_000542 [Hohenbuehelia grisea]|uniref:Uncharacterized protein n=1 Tax=Hohenbuehelia grisea TaxID=104357 RepID=A0ABR3JS58_9AGAR